MDLKTAILLSVVSSHSIFHCLTDLFPPSTHLVTVFVCSLGLLTPENCELMPPMGQRRRTRTEGTAAKPTNHRRYKIKWIQAVEHVWQTKSAEPNWSTLFPEAAELTYCMRRCMRNPPLHLDHVLSASNLLGVQTEEDDQRYQRVVHRNTKKQSCAW